MSDGRRRGTIASTGAVAGGAGRRAAGCAWSSPGGGFPWRAPTVPRGVEVPPKKKHTGADFDTDWARPAAGPGGARRRSWRARCAASVKVLADPELVGLDRLADLRAAVDDDDDPPARSSSPPTTTATSTPR